jgi:hypothetical protein
MAAKLLGIGKTTLYRKLLEYGVQVEPSADLSVAAPSSSASDPDASGTPPGSICA